MKINKYRFILLVLVFIFPVNTWALTLVEDGKSKSVIIIPTEATKQEISAAKDLQKYLTKISGAEADIKTEGMYQNKIPIYIGHSNAAEGKGLIDRVKKVKDDGYIIKVTSESMYLVGKGPLATRFAVFGFLEDHLGVRWYMPGDIGEVVPSSKDIILNEGEDVQVPSFPMRWIGSGDWALRNRMNVRVDKKLGIHVYGIAHTFRKLCSVEEYYEQHPEYFALIDGKRKRYEGEHKNQLCTSNPEVIKVVAENASEILEDRPELDVMTIFPNDGVGFCECKNCKALDDQNSEITVEDINKRFSLLGPEKYRVLSRRMTIFYNEVAKRILDRHPNKYIQFGAYSAYRQPPENLNINMPDHTILLITHCRCHNKAIESGGCNTQYLKEINGWKKIFPSFSIYEYYWKLAANELPYPIVHSIKKDIPYFYQKGCFGLYTQYSNRNVGTLGLNYYIAAKLLWNYNANVDSILNEFYNNFYGLAWRPMKAYHEALEKTVIENNIHLPAKYNELPLLFKYLIVDCQKYLNQARQLANGKNAIINRINLAEISLGYVELVTDYLKSIDNILQESGWNWKIAITAKEFSNSINLAAEIKTYLEKHELSNVFFTSPTNKYLSRFLTPEYVIKKYGRPLRIPQNFRVK